MGRHGPSAPYCEAGGAPKCRLPSCSRLAQTGFHSGRSGRMAKRNNGCPTRRGAITAAAAAGFLAPTAARSQGGGGSWPNRPIRVVVAWPPGGGADIPARLAAGPMGQTLGQTVVVENRAGASGSVAEGVVSQAPPDGYTVLADTAGISVNHLLIPGL